MEVLTGNCEGRVIFQEEDLPERSPVPFKHLLGSAKALPEECRG